MPVFKDSEMTMYSTDGEWSHPCEVRLSEGSIAVSYDEDGRLVVYEGAEIEPGHFKLRSQNAGGRATLHRFGEDDVLEGSWFEAGLAGMWRIQIDM